MSTGADNPVIDEESADYNAKTDCPHESSVGPKGTGDGPHDSDDDFEDAGRSNGDSETDFSSKGDSETDFSSKDVSMYSDASLGFRDMINILLRPKPTSVSSRAVNMIKPFNNDWELISPTAVTQTVKSKYGRKVVKSLGIFEISAWPFSTMQQIA